MTGRVQAVAYYLGLVLAIFGAANYAPAIVALVTSDQSFALYLIIGTLMIALGYVLHLFGRGASGRELKFCDAAAIATLSFIVPALANALVMYVSNYDFTDALFESISGITTTGLSMYIASSLPPVFVFARAWLQWLGGVGIVILTLSLLAKPGTATYRLFSTHFRRDPSLPSSSILSKYIVLFYAGLTSLAFLAYTTTGIPLFDALIYSLTTTSTGGFSGYTSLSGNSALVAMIFMFLSSQSFILYYRVLRDRDLKHLLRDTQLASFTLITILGGATLFAVWRSGMSTVFFHFISALSTTGYSTISINSLPVAGQLLLILAMFVGASMSSTGGGIKQFRVIVAFKAFVTSTLRLTEPKERIHIVKVANEQIEDSEVLTYLTVILMYAVIIALSGLAFTAFGYDLLSSLFSVTSALGTVGLQPSIITPQLPAILKCVLMINMVLGRLEVITVFAAFIGLIRLRER